MTRLSPLALLALGLTTSMIACKEDEKSPITDDSGITDSGDTGDTGADCSVHLTEADPATGASSLYYRDPFVLSFDGDASSAVFTLTDASGAAIETSAVWSDGNVQATLTGDMAPSTTYTLNVSLCGASTDLTYTTSSLGEPLSISLEEMQGRTYVFRISDTTIVEPALLNAVADQYLTVPLLLSIDSVDSASIDLLGALGYQTDLGDYRQISDAPTWDFPAGSFAEAPYFEAETESITIRYESVDIPVYNFALDGVFTSDGSMMAEGHATGLADSRTMGALVGAGDAPDAVCGLAASLGIDCTECPDGEPYCLYLVIEDITAEYTPGLTVTPVAGAR